MSSGTILSKFGRDTAERARFPNRYAFVEYVLSEDGQALLADYNFEAVPQDVIDVGTAALAMLLLRDAGIFTVHFAGIPPGTSALLIKFLPPERLAELGGADAFARAVDDGISSLAALLHDPDQIRSLLLEKTT